MFTMKIETKKQKISFADWGYTNVSPTFLEVYWDYEKNEEIDPWKITCKNNKKVWIKCQNATYHGSYSVNVSNFTARNSRCPYCKGKKVHPNDSLGKYISSNFGNAYLASVWSSKNEKTAFEFSQKSNKKVIWECQNGIHGEYERSICDSNTSQFRCPKCQINAKKSIEDFTNEVYSSVGNEYLVLGEYVNNKTKIEMLHLHCGQKYSTTPDAFNQGRRCPFCNESRGEKRIREFLIDRGIDFIPQKTFEGLIGLRKGRLSYDFFLPENRILIEFQGQYHDGTAGNQSELEFKIQQEHDKLKRDYSEKHQIELLEIWYWEYENIDNILQNKINNKLYGGTINV